MGIKIFKAVLILILTGVLFPFGGKGEFYPKSNPVSLPSFEPAPEAYFEDGNGNTLKISELKGKVVFMNFWATWCGPCRVEMPSINELYTQLSAHENIAFLLVDVDGNYKKSSTFLRKKQWDLPLYIPAGEIPEAYLDRSIPRTVILNKKGEFVVRHTGSADYSDPKMVKFLEDLASERG